MRFIPFFITTAPTYPTKNQEPLLELLTFTVIQYLQSY